MEDGTESWQKSCRRCPACGENKTASVCLVTVLRPLHFTITTALKDTEKVIQWSRDSTIFDHTVGVGSEKSLRLFTTRHDYYVQIQVSETTMTYLNDSTPGPCLTLSPLLRLSTVTNISIKSWSGGGLDTWPESRAVLEGGWWPDRCEGCGGEGKQVGWKAEWYCNGDWGWGEDISLLGSDKGVCRIALESSWSKSKLCGWWLKCSIVEPISSWKLEGPCNTWDIHSIVQFLENKGAYLCEELNQGQVDNGHFRHINRTMIWF